MKNLIVYATKYGASKLIAEALKQNLNGQTDIVNVSEKKPDLNGYDCVIAGGGIYMNKLNKKIVSFINKNNKILMEKKLGLFVVCYTPPDTEGYFEQFYSEELREHAAAKGILGGLMQYDKMGFVYRKIFSSLKKIDDFNEKFIEPKIEYEIIKEFCDKLQ